MKINISCLMLFCMILASCKKDHSVKITPTGSAFKITYKVGFSQQLVSFGSKLQINSLATSSADTSLTHIAVLYYAVYDSNGNTIHIIKQSSTDSGFGSYTDNLQAGTYTIVVAGGQSGLLYEPDNDGVSTTKLSKDIILYPTPSQSSGLFYPFIYDTFFKKITLTVSNTNANENIVMDRIVSKLTVVVKDMIPSSAKSLGVVFNSGLATKFYVGTSSPGPAITPSNIVNYKVAPLDNTLATTDIGKANYTMSSIILYTSTISLDVFGSSQPISYSHDGSSQPGIITDKTINNITCSPNTETILSGTLFGGSGTGGLNVTIDSTWKSTTITKSFP